MPKTILKHKLKHPSYHTSLLTKDPFKHTTVEISTDINKKKYIDNFYYTIDKVIGIYVAIVYPLL